MKYIIQDWTGKRLFLNQEFDSFQEGWDYIYENVDNETYNQTQNENDNVYQEYFVVVKNE